MVVYLDNAASPPMRVEAVEAVTLYMNSFYGNPSGVHKIAMNAYGVIDDARQDIARVFRCLPEDVIFTSGGTESDNMAVLGANKAGLVACSEIEHPAVRNSVLETSGELLKVDSAGQVIIEHLEAVLEKQASLVSVGLVNNEIGTIAQLQKIKRLIERSGVDVLLHTDAVQALGLLPVERYCQLADVISLSGHKIGGPQGVGVLIVKRSKDLFKRSFGGKQESEIRAGTQNVAGIVGFNAALKATLKSRESDFEKVQNLKDLLVGRVIQENKNAIYTTKDMDTSPAITHFIFRGIPNEVMLMHLDQNNVCASGGSACASGASEPSYVLKALGYEDDDAISGIRFSLSHDTTESDIDLACKAIKDINDRLS